MAVITAGLVKELRERTGAGMMDCKKALMEINREEYDNWRYPYPEFDTTQRWAKVPSQELSDALVEAFKDHLKDK